MPAQSGTGGTVTSTTEGATRSATVHYPGPPPHTEVYEDLTAAQLARFDRALDHSADTPPMKVDVTADASGTVTSITNRR
jgi:hypothetical protein